MECLELLTEIITLNFSYEEILTGLNTAGTLLSGIGTLILAIVSVYVLYSFERWKKESIIKKKSQVAEETLDLLEASLDGINKWLTNANSWFIYSRQSQANQSKFHELSEEKQKKFNKHCNDDPYEVTNFCRSFQQDFSKFIAAKNKAFRLNEGRINQDFIQLESTLKTLPSKVMRLHHSNFPEKEKTITREYLEQKASNEIQELTDQIKQLLLTRIHFA